MFRRSGVQAFRTDHAQSDVDVAAPEHRNQPAESPVTRPSRRTPAADEAGWEPEARPQGSLQPEDLHPRYLFAVLAYVRQRVENEADDAIRPEAVLQAVARILARGSAAGGSQQIPQQGSEQVLNRP